MDKVLKRIYYDYKHPASFSGVLKLARAAKVPIKKAKEWLTKQDAYTLHKPVRFKFPRRKVMSYGIGELMQVDLVDMSKFARYNGGIKYLLTAIDVFSKFAYVIPLKKKNANNLVEAFKQLFRKARVRITKIQSDFGGEFYNVKVRKLFEEENVHHYSSQSDFKCSVVERWNRFLKNKLYRIFSYRNSYKYIDVLESVVKSYNNSVHSVTKVAPSKVKPEMEALIFKRLYGFRPALKHDFKVGETIRISKAKKVFRRGYLPSWTDEIFTIYKVYPSVPPTFLLRDSEENVLKGRFYKFELQKVTKTKRDFWRIEKIIKTRGQGSEKEMFVKWAGFSNRFNSWVRAEWMKQ